MAGNRDLEVAVVTGGHPFDVKAFHRVFRQMKGVSFYPQHLEHFTADISKGRGEYDVAVFYHMLMPLPDEKGKFYERAIRPVIEQLGETSMGLFVLHHAILAWPEWPVWSEIVGIQDRKFDYHVNQELRVHVEAADHPITRGLADWDMIDETYTMNDALAEEGNQVLLTTEHQPSMRTLAWTRPYKKARVFCFQSGHDDQTYRNPGFLRVMEKGIQWCAGRI